MTCGKCEYEGKHPSFRHEAKQGIGWKDSSQGILPAGRLQNTIWCGGGGGDGKVGNYAGIARRRNLVCRPSLLGGCVGRVRAILGLGSMSVNRIEWCTSGTGWCTEPNRVS